MQSNIAIKSNIYVNKTKSQYDPEFISQVRGYEALKELKKHKGTMSPWQFSKAQKEELDYGQPDCSLDKSGTKAWGLIIENDVPIFVCKCEKTDCAGWGTNKGYSECSNYSNFRKIERKQEAVTIDEVEYTAPDFGLLRYLDPEEKIIYLETVKTSKEEYAPPEILIKPSAPDTKKTELQIDNTSKTETIEENIDSEPAPLAKIVRQPQTYIAMSVAYKRIDKPDEIIESSIKERLIINAGPGTGKTYSVIKRLAYIINNELADPSNVLVLCYSRSAVGVIKKRIMAEIRMGNMPVEALQLFDGIRTFDYFVTYMLVDADLEGTINNLNYDERIERFIIEIKKDKTVFDWLEYLIVDEMQDLVGVRARMVKAILEQINCGFLLLGDMCQSIYDYQIRDEKELNSFRYYKWLNSQFDTGVKRFELTENVRQKEEIAMFTEYMRNAILSEETDKQAEALDLCVGTLQGENNLGNIRKIERINYCKTEAFLCRNNAEVSIISTELYAKDIEHRISKRAQHIDLVPWIAEILSTYTESRIGITAFRERALAAGYKDTDTKWELLKSVAADDNDKVLDVKLLVKALVGGKDLPVELDLASRDIVTVSTIHRAKGCEYDGVFLISDDYNKGENTMEETKVAYVALTRGKEEICFCNLPDEYNHDSGYFIKKYYKKVERLSNENRGRFYAYMWNPRKKNKYPFCSNFEMGLAGDVNQYSFVHKKNNAPEIQDRIRKLKIGDLIKAKYDKGHYYLYDSCDEIIGNLSNDVILDICIAMEEQNPGYKYYKNYQKPSALKDIYVNNVVTIANTRFNDVIAEPYNKSGLWLGVEISGFAKTDRS
jgi:hypothetical protein